jgi:hypothetical protein
MRSDPMDNLPTLPTDITMGSAGLWAGAVLLEAAQARGWPSDDLRRLLLTVVAIFAADDASDEQIIAELRAALDQVRAGRMLKS